MAGRQIRLDALLRDPTDRVEALAAMPLMVEREGRALVLPEGDAALVAGDRLLLAGQHEGRSRFELTVQNANVLEYVLTGSDHSGGWLWQRLAGRSAAGARA
jgi:hypothetical protein